MSRSRMLLWCLLLTSFTGLLSFRSAGVPPRFIKTGDGVIVYPDPLLSGNAGMVRLQVISDKIIRVLATPQKEGNPVKSLVTVYPKDASARWTVASGKDEVVLKTASLVARVDAKSGRVAFYDPKGNPVLAEKKGGRRLEPVVFEGERSYKVEQTFEGSADDALYGLGQHQDDLFNYKGFQVNLFQNNTEVGVPFLVSRKNYGILWDNNSITIAGDTRPYQPLSALKLFSKNGEKGYLTAAYRNRQNSDSVAVVRAESAINMEFLNDSKLQLPALFKPETGVVTWEGALASGFDGVHRLRFTYGGYLRVWLDGVQILDRWRQSWNPGSAVLQVPFAKDRKKNIRIEWVPSGSESYISFKWMEPRAASEKDAYGFRSEAGKGLDYYVITGQNLDSVISGYRLLTGKAVMLPKWAMGKWQSRERYKTQDEVLAAVAEFRKRKIPLDNIVLDWSYWKENAWGSQEFDESRFANPDSMIRVLHEQYKTHFMISVWPKFYEGIPAYNEFDKKGWLYRRNVADRQRDWIAQGYVSTFYDVFNEDAQKGFWNLIHNKLYKKGVDAWWMDASEPDILSNVSPEKRREQMTPLSAGLAAEYLSAYPLQNAKGIYEGQRSVNPDTRVFILTRSGFSGMQRYAAATWSGDIGSRWHDMKAQISAGVNFSLSGLPWWTMDIGGFAVERRYETAKGEDLEEWRELNTRWYQFGAFVPLFRVHGQYPFREIYNVAPEGHPAYSSMLYYDKLRYRLMPYIYSLAGQTYHKDYTLMRGLVMDFGKDTAVTQIGDQYLFGPSLLINPVYTYKDRSRELYLPAGQGWYDLYSGRYLKGGQKIKADAPYERMPLFVKEGSIVPFGPELQYTSEKPADTVTLYVYTGRDAAFTLYEDEGTNYNYEKGIFSTIKIDYNEVKKTLTLHRRIGEFPGMLQKRVFHIVWISKTAGKPLDFGGKPDATVSYIGDPIMLQTKL